MARENDPQKCPPVGCRVFLGAFVTTGRATTGAMGSGHREQTKKTTRRYVKSLARMCSCRTLGLALHGSFTISNYMCVCVCV